MVLIETDTFCKHILFKNSSKNSSVYSYRLQSFTTNRVKNIKKISRLNRLLGQGPKKCSVYLRLPYLGKDAKFLESKVKERVNNTIGAVNLIITHSTRTPLLYMLICYYCSWKEQHNAIIYKFKCHCDSE